ncbi:uncharacterized protein LOC118405607 [Branchiostoma floridae]|uniref:Uncharacterized protein LOC118405607 n=1 Tax=Branchiostoma floridae TaxID=7739 RepID=A0A9J7HPN3_BRAFL|nr:uncharacterized protein LOC118405607 [Branchiostoma floridae]
MGCGGSRDVRPPTGQQDGRMSKASFQPLVMTVDNGRVVGKIIDETVITNGTGDSDKFEKTSTSKSSKAGEEKTRRMRQKYLITKSRNKVLSWHAIVEMKRKSKRVVKKIRKRNRRPRKYEDPPSGPRADPASIVVLFGDSSEKETVLQDGDTPLLGIPKKQLISDIGVFKDLDEYALQTPESEEESIEKTVDYLLRRAGTDLEKARSIWRWVTARIEYDVPAFMSGSFPDMTAEAVFTRRSAVCSGYSALYKNMCSLAGLRCEEICGKSKGVGYKVGRKFKEEYNHTWNAVEIDGRWYLLDCTWGAGVVDTQRNTFIFNYNEDRFLADPEMMVLDHLPLDDKWQLLEEPKTLDQFESEVHLTPAFYACGLQPTNLSFQDGVKETQNGGIIFRVDLPKYIDLSWEMTEEDDTTPIKRSVLYEIIKNTGYFRVVPAQTGSFRFCVTCKTEEGDWEMVCAYLVNCSEVKEDFVGFPDNDGHLWGPGGELQRGHLVKVSHPVAVLQTEDGEVTVELEPKDVLDFSCELCKDGEEDIVKGCMLHEVVNGAARFRLAPPETGFYALKIYVSPSDSGQQDFQPFVEYIIDCKESLEDDDVFPDNDGAVWGPGVALREKRLKSVSHTEAVVDTKDGECTITTELPECNNASGQLFSIDDAENDIKGAVLTEIVDRKTHFRVVPPDSGKYKLSLFTVTDGCDWDPICDYVINCETAKDDVEPFPDKDGCVWGPGLALEERTILQTNQPRALAKTADGEVTISMKTSEDTDFAAQLFKAGDADNEIKGAILFEMVYDQACFKVIPPEHGYYALNIFTVSENMDWQLLCDYVIYCDEPNVDEYGQPYGPGKAIQDGILKYVSHKEAVLKTEQGEVKLSVEFSKATNFSTQLFTVDDRDNEITGHVLHQIIAGKAHIQIFPPDVGTFVMKLWTTTADWESVEVCSYLIQCNEPKENFRTFPKTHGYLWGPGLHLANGKLSNASHIPAVVVAKSGEACITIEAENAFNSCVIQNVDEECLPPQHHFMETVGNKITICARLPAEGYYALSIWEEDANDKIYYLLRCDEATDDRPLFPLVNEWPRGCELHEPRDGSLPSKQNIHFRVTCPSAEGLWVMLASGDRTNLTKDDKGSWESGVNTGAPGDLTLWLKMEGNLERVLLIYHVV